MTWQADYDQLVRAAHHVSSIGFVFRRLLLESGWPSTLVAERHAIGLMKERERTLRPTAGGDGERERSQAIDRERRYGADRRRAGAPPPGGYRYGC